MTAPVRGTGPVLVTGGSRGIGAAVCARLATQGRAIAVSYRADAAAAAAMVAAIERAGGTARAFQVDVADDRSVERLFDAVEAQLGVPSALVNSAGITGGIGPFANTTPDTWQRTFQVNVFGTMRCCHAALARWRAQGITGAIVNLSSIAATSGAPGEYVHYAASKAAVEAFTIGLGRELAPDGIRVNAVSPGTTLTDIHAGGGDPDRPARVAARIPLGRAARPEEIAAAVCWLLSDEASYATGTIMRVAGGL